MHMGQNLYKASSNKWNNTKVSVLICFAISWDEKNTKINAIIQAAFIKL
jgi:hypothetical protein